MSISTKRTFLFKASMSFISSSVKEKSKIWNNRNKQTNKKQKQTFGIVVGESSLGLGRGTSSGNPSEIYGHLCKCPRGAGQVLEATPPMGSWNSFCPWSLRQSCWGHLAINFKCSETICIQNISWNSRSKEFLLLWYKMLSFWFWTVTFIHFFFFTKIFPGL